MHSSSIECGTGESCHQFDVQYRWFALSLLFLADVVVSKGGSTDGSIEATIWFFRCLDLDEKFAFGNTPRKQRILRALANSLMREGNLSRAHQMMETAYSVAIFKKLQLLIFIGLSDGRKFVSDVQNRTLRRPNRRSSSNSGKIHQPRQRF